MSDTVITLDPDLPAGFDPDDLDDDIFPDGFDPASDLVDDDE